MWGCPSEYKLVLEYWSKGSIKYSSSAVFIRPCWRREERNNLTELQDDDRKSILCSVKSLSPGQKIHFNLIVGIKHCFHRGAVAILSTFWACFYPQVNVSSGQRIYQVDSRCTDRIFSNLEHFLLFFKDTNTHNHQLKYRFLLPAMNQQVQQGLKRLIWEYCFAH